VDWGIFATSLRNDCADTPYILQGKCDMPVVLSSNFTMSNGGIMATTPQGLMVGGSNSVSNESYYLSFGFAENTTSTPPVSLGVYCVMVRTECLGFL
jgi:hypothetical protein